MSDRSALTSPRLDFWACFAEAGTEAAGDRSSTSGPEPAGALSLSPLRAGLPVGACALC